MNAGRDVRSMIPTGCDDCAEVAQRICQASTSSSSGASNQGPCAAGDTVKAVWAGNGEQYLAVIVSMHAGHITVNWDDGDSQHRVVKAEQVFKNKYACSTLTEAPTLAPTPVPRSAPTLAPTPVPRSGT